MIQSAPRLTVESDIPPIAEAWDELAARSGAAPFFTRDWFEAWSAAFAPGQLQVATLRRDGRLAALLPLQKRGRRLVAAANWHTPIYGPLAEDRGAGVELLEEVFRHDPRGLELAFVDASDGGLEEIASAARSAGRPVAARTLMCSPLIALSGSYEDYERSLSKNRRKGLRRSTRALQQAGVLTLDIELGEGNLDATLDEAFAIESSGWKGRRGTAIASNEDTLTFYRGLARRAASRSWLRLALLRLDGRPLAFDFALEQGGAWYSLKAGYEHSAARFGPGGVLLAMLLRRAYAHGLDRFELLGDSDSFKLSFANGMREVGWLAAFAPSPAGRAEASVVKLRERVRPAVRRLRTTMFANERTLSLLHSVPPLAPIEI